MQYPDLVQTLAAEIPTKLADATGLSATPFVDANYNTELPRFIEWAELKMQRDPDLDFLAMRSTLTPPAATVVGKSQIALPPTMIVPLEIGYYTPAGATAANGAFVPLAPVSRDFLRFAYSGAAHGPPQYYARADDNSLGTSQGQILLGPAPDGIYTMSFYGTVRFAPMSSTNLETWIGDNLPDLFWAAIMERVSAYQRNFVAMQGSDGSQPQLTASWATLYQEAKRGAAVESARQKAQSAGWQVQAPTPVATPPRS